MSKTMIYTYKRINGKETVEVNGQKENPAEETAKQKEINKFHCLIQLYTNQGVL